MWNYLTFQLCEMVVEIGNERIKWGKLYEGYRRGGDNYNQIGEVEQSISFLPCFLVCTEYNQAACSALPPHEQIIYLIVTYMVIKTVN